MSSPLFNAIGSANFGSPASADDTSAPAIPQAPAMPTDQPIPNPLAKVLASKKGKKPNKASPQLVAAIARARKAKPSSEKFG